MLQVHLHPVCCRVHLKLGPQACVVLHGPAEPVSGKAFVHNVGHAARQTTWHT